MQTFQVVFPDESNRPCALEEFRLADKFRIAAYSQILCSDSKIRTVLTTLSLSSPRTIYEYTMSLVAKLIRA